MFGTRKLGKTSAQRKALLRQQVTDLLENGKMETTFYRAKEVQPVVEKMITLGKKGDLAAYRRALSFVTKMLHTSCSRKSLPSTLTARAATPE